ncbi:MAG: 3',5'-cyclic-nucleotide phosphodiesterase [Vicinamibacteria bacterium]|nr:3',5'-cyclic-nucleotide phosphodiesterase [Vicinamibacteria bacterium]
MKVKVLGCYGGIAPGRGMTSFLINDTVALDAGGLSFALPVDRQAKVKDVFISHAHLDHTCCLPFLIDNSFASPGFSLRIYGIHEVVTALAKHLFNGSLWPDFTSIPDDLTPVLKLVTLEPEKAVKVGNLSVRAISVSHSVPTTGFVVDDGKASLAFSSDTGPTHRFWDVVNATKNLKAVITESSFPNSEEGLARISGHLTPALLGMELSKLGRDVPIYVYGAKPRFVSRIKSELAVLKRKNLRMFVQGRTYAI